MRTFQNELENDGAYDCAPTAYCKAIAEHLSRATGEPWKGRRNSPAKVGFYVVPEYDLDPINFPDGALGGVELITPPLSLNEAEALRASIVEAVKFEGGFIWPEVPESFGWHVNVDKVRRGAEFNDRTVLAALSERGRELDVLLESCRYSTGYAKPQHHSYGPRLLSILQNPWLTITERDVSEICYKHRGQTKSFATNLGKLRDRGYVELRHFGLVEFMDPISHKMPSLFGSIISSFLTTADQATALETRLFRRFKLLNEWLVEIAANFRMVTKPSAGPVSSSTVVQLDGEDLVHVNDLGVVTLGFKHRWRPGDLDLTSLSMDHGIDADDLFSGIGILALDAAHADRLGMLRPLLCSSFEDKLQDLSIALLEEGLAPYPAKKMD